MLSTFCTAVLVYVTTDLQLVFIYPKISDHQWFHRFKKTNEKKGKGNVLGIPRA